VRLSYAPVKVPQIILEVPVPWATQMLGIHAKQYRRRMPFCSHKRCGNWCIRSVSDSVSLKADARNLLIASPTTNVVAFTRAVLAAEGFDPDSVRRPAYREVSEFVHAAFLGHSEQEQTNRK
jgi:hypothetical protein